MPGYRLRIALRLPLKHNVRERASFDLHAFRQAVREAPAHPHAEYDQHDVKGVQGGAAAALASNAGWDGHVDEWPMCRAIWSAAHASLNRASHSRSYHPR